MLTIRSLAFLPSFLQTSQLPKIPHNFIQLDTTSHTSTHIHTTSHTSISFPLPSHLPPLHLSTIHRIHSKMSSQWRGIFPANQPIPNTKTPYQSECERALITAALVDHIKSWPQLHIGEPLYSHVLKSPSPAPTHPITTTTTAHLTNGQSSSQPSTLPPHSPTHNSADIRPNKNKWFTRPSLSTPPTTGPSQLSRSSLPPPLPTSPGNAASGARALPPMSREGARLQRQYQSQNRMQQQARTSQNRMQQHARTSNIPWFQEVAGTQWTNASITEWQDRVDYEMYMRLVERSVHDYWPQTNGTFEGRMKRLESIVHDDNVMWEAWCNDDLLRVVNAGPWACRWR